MFSTMLEMKYYKNPSSYQVIPTDDFAYHGWIVCGELQITSKDVDEFCFQKQNNHLCPDFIMPYFITISKGVFTAPGTS